ncbi:hypothetical protein [uncultured Hyphomicrobium sp.]|uniref:hypothetical protein n=1 Tax=uncultured Hyphomicrobium sp. TaxID=194373 RepID=UPI0025EF2701|nr:hypothetical protein [uncultured Hyphomicrobium sp.]
MSWLSALKSFHQALTEPPNWETSLAYPDAYAVVRDILVSSYYGPNWWTLRTDDPEMGHLIGTLEFVEDYGQIQNLHRSMVLGVRLEDLGGKTRVIVDWDINSPMGSHTCKKIKSYMMEWLRKRLPV